MSIDNEVSIPQEVLQKAERSEMRGPVEAYESSKYLKNLIRRIEINKNISIRRNLWETQ
mgnify:FL=1|tara:strand:- start:663 stop:839 length:177 start_codon:yes stop_codon:yes gene_type:complete